MRPVTLLIFSASCLFFTNRSAKQVDLIVHHGIVYTVNNRFETAQAFAVSNGKIIAVGNNTEILKTYSGKEMIDAKGQAVYPGFIDAHAHFVSYGQSLFQADLFGTNSWDELLERLQKFAAANPGEKWIIGSGWDQNKWPGKSFPTNEK